MYRARPMEKHCVSLGKLATVFQAEITEIDQCAMRNVKKGYKNRTICIVSDRKACCVDILKKVKKQLFAYSRNVRRLLESVQLI